MWTTLLNRLNAEARALLELTQAVMFRRLPRAIMKGLMPLQGVQTRLHPFAAAYAGTHVKLPAAGEILMSPYQ